MNQKAMSESRRGHSKCFHQHASQTGCRGQTTDTEGLFVRYQAAESVKTIYIVACRAITKQRPRDRRIYQSRYYVAIENKHVSTTNRRATIVVLLEKMSLRGPGRDVTSKAQR
jgi:hypothetical protein